MDKNYQFYKNQKKYGCLNPRERDFQYLLTQNFLSEYKTEVEKEEVLYNLGLLQRLDILKNIIDAKVIEAGGIAWDVAPTLGNAEQVLSSDVIYQTLQKYYTEEEVDELIETLWNNIFEEIGKIVKVDDSLSKDSTNPVQNKVIKAALDLKADKAELEEYIRSNIQSDLIPNLLGYAKKQDLNTLEEKIEQLEVPQKALEDDIREIWNN